MVFCLATCAGSGYVSSLTHGLRQEGGLLPRCHVAYMATAYIWASTEQWRPEVLLQRRTEEAYVSPPFVEGMASRWMVDASYDNRHFRPLWLGLLLVIFIEDSHGANNVVYSSNPLATQACH